MEFQEASADHFLQPDAVLVDVRSDGIAKIHHPREPKSVQLPTLEALALARQKQAEDPTIKRVLVRLAHGVQWNSAWGESSRYYIS